MQLLSVPVISPSICVLYSPGFVGNSTLVSLVPGVVGILCEADCIVGIDKGASFLRLVRLQRHGCCLDHVVLYYRVAGVCLHEHAGGADTVAIFNPSGAFGFADAHAIAI